MSIVKNYYVELMQLAYESFSTDVKLSNLTLSARYLESQLAYEWFSKDVKTSSIPYPGDVPTLKLTCNILQFVFKGKAFLFDGSIKEVGSPVIAIYPVVAGKEDRGYVTGGLTEEGTIVSDLFVRGVESYVMTADRDYIAVVIPTDTVYVLDSVGNVVSTHSKLGVLPLLTGWKLVSRKPFIAIIQRLL